MSGVVTILVESDEGGLRLDRWFKQRFPALGHGRLERLLRTGQIRVDGRRAKSGTRLAPGQAVRVPPLAEPETSAANRGTRPLSPVSDADIRLLRAAVLHEDDWVIAINKPPGLAVQGGSGQTRYLDAMLGAFGEGDGEPRLVHRLDKDTSGVLLLAKSAAAARALTASFKSRQAQKVYWALVVGTPEVSRGSIDLALAKQPGPGGEKVGVAGDDDGGKPAQTLFQVVEKRRALTWLVMMPLTGRTHQLRAHCAAMGTPIAGDGKYGGRQAIPEGLAAELLLHAREIALPHPDDGTTLRVTAPPPPHMAAVWRKLGFDERKAEQTLAELLNYAEGLAHSPPGTKPKAKKADRRTGTKPARHRARKSLAKGSKKPPGKPSGKPPGKSPGKARLKRARKQTSKPIRGAKRR
jgi:23S rRNA pseudouridine955/2504/2580 synthase